MITSITLWNEPNHRSHRDFQMDPEWRQFSTMTKMAVRTRNIGACMPSSRVLDLSELSRPFFRATIHAMETLLRELPSFYLHPSKRWEYPWALENAHLKMGSHVLDAGCGASVFPVYLSRLGHRVVACDVDLDRNLVRQVPVPYVQANLTDMPFHDAQFDAAFCISVLEHLDRSRMTAALGELRRVLRPGGRLLLTTAFYEDHRAALRYAGPGSAFPVDWNFFDRELLEQIVLNHEGFLVENPPNLDVDWSAVREQMLAFHGYPYTSVGIVLTRH